MSFAPPVNQQKILKSRYPSLDARQWKVFLSFSGNIRKEVEKVYDALLRSGLTQEEIFFDKYTIPPGGEFEPICKFGVANSLLFVGIVDAQYLTKKDPQMEANYNFANKALKQTMIAFYGRSKSDLEAMREKVAKGELHLLQHAKCQTVSSDRTRNDNNETEWGPVLAKEIKGRLAVLGNYEANPTEKEEKRRVESFWPAWMTTDHYNNINLNDVHFIGSEEDRKRFVGSSQNLPLNNVNSPTKVIVLPSADGTFDKQFTEEKIAKWKSQEKSILFPLFLASPNDVSEGKQVHKYLGTIMKSDETREQFFQRAAGHLRRVEANSYYITITTIASASNNNAVKRAADGDPNPAPTKKARTEPTDWELLIYTI